MRKQNTKTTKLLDVVPERCSKRFPPRFWPVGRFCELRLRYLSSPTAREGEISRPLDHIRQNPFIETWEVLEAKVKAVIKEKLQIDVDIERAHRVERRKPSKRQNTNQPRTIVCRLRVWKQREAVVRKARKVKPEGLYVSEDLAPETLLKREAQIPKLKAAKESGKIAYFILDRLVIREKPA